MSNNQETDSIFLFSIKSLFHEGKDYLLCHNLNIITSISFPQKQCDVNRVFVCFFLNYSKTPESNKLKLLGMISLGLQMVLG